MDKNIHIQDGLTALKEAHFQTERAFFAFNASTSMDRESKQSANDLLQEMESMIRQLRLMNHIPKGVLS